MVFWLYTAALVALIGGLLAVAVRRGPGVAGETAQFDVQVYKDQLTEVERDLARGTLDAESAERTRTEIARRILAADANAQTSPAAKPNRTRSNLALAFAALILLGSFGVYTWLGAPGYGDMALERRISLADELRAQRPSQAIAEDNLPAPTEPLEAPSSDYADLVTQLRGVVAERPNDAQGLRLLAISERSLGNFSQAHQAFARYLALQGPRVSAEDQATYADMLVLAAGGFVSPEAETALRSALDADPNHPTALYYWGLMMSQTGRPDQAFRIWDGLLRQGPPDAPWIPPIQAQIDEMALRAGIRYTQPPPGGLSGPSTDDMNAAAELSPSERLEMIEGMVAGLADRLANEGGPAPEWARLITSLGVLGRLQEARAVYDNALEAFAADPGGLDQIRRAGQQAGVAN